jgi:acetyl-CoA carboxylase biotin carboxyl carrier protein
MDSKEIQALIKFVVKSGAQEVSLETEEFKINIKTASGALEQQTSYIQTIAPQQAMQAAPVQVAVAVAGETEAEGNENYITIKSPMIGTFYRSQSPEHDVFVKVGDTIGEGDVLCIVEAMKLFNEIESEVSGTIVKVLVDDRSPIEYDQPLFLVDPS